MKRLLVLFAVLAFTACTSEEPIGSDLLNEEVGTPTYATFTFNAGDAVTKSSMITDENETDALNNVRVLIFRTATNILEIDTSLTTAPDYSMLTIPLQSGTKRILAIANGGSGMFPAKGSDFTYADFSEAIYNISNADPVSDPTTGIDNLSNLVKPTGYVMTNSVRNSLINLDPGVSAAESQTEGNSNHVSIGLQRTVAKVTVFQYADASLTTVDGSGTLSNLKYSIINVNRSFYLFQNYFIGLLRTPEYIPTASSPDPDPVLYSQYYKFYNYQELLTESLASNLSASKTMYITENNPSIKTRGNTTFISIEAIFTPKKDYFTKDISYNEELGAFTVTLSETDLETASDIYKFTNPNVPGLLVGTLLAGVDAGKLAQKVTYHLENPTVPPKASLDDPIYAAIGDSEVEKYFEKYTGGKCYYRVDIGNQSNEGMVDYTIIRNHHYIVGITTYLQIGTCQKTELLPENEISQGPTNVTASFNVVDWTDHLIIGIG